LRNFFNLFLSICLILFSVSSFSSPNNANVLSLSATSTNIPTSSYVQLSSSSPIPASKLVIVNTTSSIVTLGTGSSGSEVGLVAVLPSGMAVLQLGAVLSSGTRLALEAIGSAASSGYVTVSLIP